MVMCDLKIMNWNVRGLNCPARRETVLQMLQAVQPSIVCLQETKLEVIDSLLGTEFLGPALSSFDYIPAQGVRGGVLIAWNDALVEATNPEMHGYCLSIEMKLRLSNTSFLLTSVYGPSTDSDKHLFLSELAAIKPPARTPWLCLGDFNLIYAAHDKNNRNLNRRLMGQFRNTLDDCELMEIALQNWAGIIP